MSIDPTRTITLRKAFATSMSKRFLLLRRNIVDLVRDQDALGLVTNQKYASTQVNIDDVGPLVKRLQSQLSKKDVIELEDKPHVTIRYGLHGEDPELVQRVIGKSGLIWLRLGNLSLFRSPDQDVLKIAVHSSRLDELNRQLGILPNTQKFREYNPHLTIAYLKPGTGDKYLDIISGLEGKLVLADKIAFSDKERNHTTIVMNTRWQYQTNMQKLEAFRIWLQDQMQSAIKGANEWWEYYVQQGYEKGAKRAVQDVMKGMTGLEKTKKGFNITERQFMESSFGRVVPVEKVKILASRVISDLDGITDYMETNIMRALTDGLVQGRHPKDIAVEMAKTVDIGLNRAKLIAQTEIVRSHAEGVLDNLERMGVEEVGVMVEWSTSNDNRVCPLCKPLQGVVLTVDEARGLFPRHPRCRCSPVPATIIQRKGQVRTKGSIDAAIDQSLGLERKSTKRGIFSRGSSAWAGAKVKIRRNRPALKR